MKIGREIKWRKEEGTARFGGKKTNEGRRRAKKEEREVEVDCGGKLGRRKKNKRECKREKGTERVKGERARERERENEGW